MVEGRDAIYKEFLFKDFNEVRNCTFFFTTIRHMYILLLLELHDLLFHLSTSSSSVLGTIMAS